MPSHSKSLGDRVQISVYIDRDVKARLEALATADERSLNAYIVRLIREHVERESRDKAAGDE